MNLLLINHYAGSPHHGMEFRPYYLAREWVRAGHRVRIVAAAYSHVRSRQPQLPGGGARPLDETLDGIAYRWLPAPRYVGNGLGRVRNIAAFLGRLWRETPALVDDFAPDVVIASSTYPMDVWVARRIARRARAKLVYEVHDLWPLSPIELAGMSPRHPFARLCQKAEDDAYRDADVVVSMLPKVAEHMRAHGLDLRKLHIVPNGVALDEWEGAPVPLAAEFAARLAALKADGRTIVGYAGSHGLPNALDVLLDAAALLRDAPIAFVLVGDGHEKARLEARVRDEHLTHVTLLPPVPKAQIPALLHSFEIAYIGWQRVPIYRFGIAPNKLMDYMMAGRAVLHSVEAGNDPVAEAGCGLTVTPESAAAVADGLRALIALPAAERAAMGARGRAYVIAHHSYRVLAQRFVDAVEAA
jgi:glycosyltransferase involved in cell wall biosynthesis